MATAKIHILIVEIEPTSARNIASTLKAKGYKITIAASGESAMVAIRKHRPDFVMTPLGSVEADLSRIVTGESTTETESRLAELERSNAELERFAQIASHDLQEPLRTVSMYAGLLDKRLLSKSDGDVTDFLKHIMNGIRRMHEMIRALLEYSRIGGETENLHEQIDTSNLVEHAVEDHQETIKMKGAKVEIGDLPVVIGLRHQIDQLFQNLIGNALKFTANRAPHVQIAAVRDGSLGRFSFRDMGCGFEPKFKDQIFNPFQRLHSREEFPGTGLGLATCKKIVTLHGGKIWVESTPGTGSTFYFTLPAADAFLPRSKRKKSAPHRRTPRHN